MRQRLSRLGCVHNCARSPPDLLFLLATSCMTRRSSLKKIDLSSTTLTSMRSWGYTKTPRVRGRTSRSIDQRLQQLLSLLLLALLPTLGWQVHLLHVKHQLHPMRTQVSRLESSPRPTETP